MRCSLQATTHSTVLNAVPMLLHRRLNGVCAKLVECRPHRGTIGVMGGTTTPPPHTYDLVFALTGASIIEALEHLAQANEPILIVCTIRHAHGVEVRASGWQINRYAPNQIVLTIRTPVPHAVEKLTVQIENLEPLSWDI